MSHKTDQVSKPEWQSRQYDYRVGVTNSIEAIRNGVIDEQELHCLSNFCQTALALISTMRQIDWQRAAQVAEIRGLLHPEDPLNQVYYIGEYKNGNE